ncbi:hypothetical protein B0T16DRAFT_315428 [Cercophora newfieldiana]|uniref:Uncharacterized protein n=1 Tax=Cercophora newfieldiana TaxID=92897 RepID=A0AA40D106_9PEZI|nr:hypothetical protein B0T16DRAFT_315428 [Cercophora newfieldiana]
MAGTRKRELHVESSWRMVEGGENDSFDASILHDDDDLVISSASEPSQLSGSQPMSFGGSQPFSIGGSQDESLQTFLDRAANDDEQILKRNPFAPSAPREVRHSARDAMKHRSPEPEFFMPTVEVESPRRGSSRSSRTIRPMPPPALPGLRRRQVTSKSGRYRGSSDGPQPRAFGDRVTESLPDAIFNVLSWILDVIALAFRYAQKPLAIFLALYLTFGGLIIVQNMATKSLYASLSPVCRLPGASWLNLPFCPDITPMDGKGTPKRAMPVEFDGLMKVQDEFEGILEKSAQGVSLPMEMKRTEASIRDLRTMVRHSALQGKEELVLEFDQLIDTARGASNDLQKFNTHVGSTVDSVISINRWTSRYLDTMSAEKESRGLLSDWTDWMFSPFQPAVFSERSLLDKYVEHTAMVSEKIAQLIVEAQSVLRVLTKTEGHLEVIHEFATRTQHQVQGQKNEILWTLWTLIGANNRRLNNLNGQLSTLKEVNTKRSEAVKQVSELIVELQKIQAGLDGLRDRVAEPELVRDRVDVPLSVHIETINRGVERLDAARSRMREVEDDRIKEVLARGAKSEERLIEG